MKVRVTLMTANNVPAAKFGPNPEAAVKEAWEFFLTAICAQSTCEDCAYVESVEIVEE